MIGLEKKWTGCAPSVEISRAPWFVIESGSVHDTESITYRCFLPDLTRFMTVCCVTSDLTNTWGAKITRKREFSPA